jgi:hypothetical protein
MTMTDLDARQALRETVHGVERTCAYCGTRQLCRSVKITPDRLRGTGEHVWGVCGECELSARLGNLSSVVVRDLLGLDPDDEVLRHVTVDYFCDRDASSPQRPNSTPWQHIDTDELARVVARWRADNERRRGGPCAFCGTDTTPPGTSWRDTMRGVSTCGACQAEFGGLPTSNSGVNRTHAASVLVGLRRHGATVRPLNLGSALGLTWWSESGRKEANRTPFGHLDIAAMRAEADRLQRDHNYFERPAWWKPDEVGVVDWGRHTR